MMSTTLQFSEFKDHEFLNLETFRRSGVGVPKCASRQIH